MGSRKRIKGRLIYMAIVREILNGGDIKTIRELWQDLDRTFTTNERTLSTRIDCKPALQEAA